MRPLLVNFLGIVRKRRLVAKRSKQDQDGDGFMSKDAATEGGSDNINEAVFSGHAKSVTRLETQKGSSIMKSEQLLSCLSQTTIRNVQLRVRSWDIFRLCTSNSRLDSRNILWSTGRENAMKWYFLFWGPNVSGSKAVKRGEATSWPRKKDGFVLPTPVIEWRF